MLMLDKFWTNNNLLTTHFRYPTNSDLHVYTPLRLGIFHPGPIFREFFYCLLGNGKMYRHLHQFALTMMFEIIVCIWFCMGQAQDLNFQDFCCLLGLPFC